MMHLNSDYEMSDENFECWEKGSLLVWTKAYKFVEGNLGKIIFHLKVSKKLFGTQFSSSARSHSLRLAPNCFDSQTKTKREIIGS
jgi:hypothetical protein